MRYFPSAVVRDRQAIKSSACNLATLCFCNVKNLISKSSWWTSTDRLPSFILLPSSTIIFFTPGAIPCTDTVPVAWSSTTNVLKSEWNPTCKNPLRSKARLLTGQSLGSLHCIVAEALRTWTSAGLFIILYHHFHHDTCKFWWTVGVFH